MSTTRPRKKRKSAGFLFFLFVFAFIAAFAMSRQSSSEKQDKTVVIDDTTAYYEYKTEGKTSSTDFWNTTKSTTKTTAERTTTKRTAKSYTTGRTTSEYKTNWWNTTTTTKRIIEEQPSRPTCISYNTLSNAEKAVYNLACSNIENGLNQVSFSYSVNDDGALARKIFRAVVYDHPEYFWLNNGSNIKRYKKNGQMGYTVYFGNYKFWNYITDKQKYIDAFNNQANEIVRLASQNTTDYNRIKYVHDYLALNNVYDHDAADHCFDKELDTKYEYAYTTYGSIMNRKCVCAGYAKAFQLITQKMGYACAYVCGPVSETDSHAWNSIKINGKYYNVDVTWDDRNDNRYKNAVSYLYFCIPDSEMYLTRKPYDFVVAPKAVNNDLRYYRKNSCYLLVYSFEDVNRILQKQKNAQCVGIEFNSSALAEKAYKELYNDKRLWNIDAVKENSFYSTSYIAGLRSDGGSVIEFLIS